MDDDGQINNSQGIVVVGPGCEKLSPAKDNPTTTTSDDHGI